MNALGLSRDFFLETALPALRREYPALAERAAAGLAGNGSECFGYDDALSRDHDWGVDFFLWLPEADRGAVPALQVWKARVLTEVPPEFRRVRTEHGAAVGVMTVGDFYRSLTGCEEGPSRLAEWLAVPEDNLAMAVNGAVFWDPAGEFGRVRQRLLGHYPEDLRLKRIAAACIAAAQTGQYNLGRMAARQDWVTVRTILSRFTGAVIELAFLLNKRYKPYYKWAYRALGELPLLGGALSGLLLELAQVPGLDPAAVRAQQALAEEICRLLAAELRRQGLSDETDDFLTLHGEAVQRGIGDPRLRDLPAQYDPCRV